MNDADDRLAGDPVWELFPQAVSGSASADVRRFTLGQWLFLAGVIALGLLRYPPLAVIGVCLAVAARDFRTGWQVARSIGDKVGGQVCARFAYAWGAWKVGAAAFACLPVAAFVMEHGKSRQLVPAIATAGLLWMGAFLASALLSGWGLLAAYRSGMKIWIGEGVNRARTLFLMMLIVGFVFLVMVPWCFLLCNLMPTARGEPSLGILWFTMFGIMFVGPVAILIVLDAIQRRLIADLPAKFGPKVPAVGKWNG